MTRHSPIFEIRLARDAEDMAATQRLRYEVFVEELGGDGELVDHENRLERDRFDPFYDHLLLVDAAQENRVVGVYRLMPGERAADAGGFYTEGEYDLSPLRASGRKLLELGRSCVHADYRGGAALHHLWTALADYTLSRGIEVLFGVASFHGTDITALSPQLSLLHHRHLAPPDLRVRTRAEHYQPMNLMEETAIDRREAMLAVPALIKGYLRLGGFVGDGAFIDRQFNTTDVCLILDTQRMNDRQRAIYTRGIGE